MKAVFTILLPVALSATNLYGTVDNGTERDIVDSIELRSEGRITIVQPSSLAKRLMRDTTTIEDNGNSKELLKPGTTVVHRAGYRIQVYSDNNQRTARANAERLASQISSEYPLLGTYLAYKAPYWRLKVGDFLTREEASETMTELKKSFGTLAGEMIIVRDRINVIE